MESILSCGFLRTLNTIWDTMSKLNTGGAATYQELSAKGVKWDTERVSTVGFIPHKDPLCLIEGPSVFTIFSLKRRELCDKDLSQAYNKPEKVMTGMNNYATMPSELQFLTSIPEKSLGESCDFPYRFTRFIHMIKWYLRTDKLCNWGHIWKTLR